MIQFLLVGHEFQNDVQTMIQVFYPNLKYLQVEEIPVDELCVESRIEKGIACAVLYRRGEKVGASSVAYESPLSQKEAKRLIKLTIYELLVKETGLRPQWGILTGVRPAKNVSELFAMGEDEGECYRYLTEDYLALPHKARLAIEVARAEEGILAGNNSKEISLYIGIPFCPTRCLYCSFTAYPLGQYKNKVDDYLEALFQELTYLEAYGKKYTVKNIYIGGGTPTSLTEEQFERLLKKVEELFETRQGVEYTVEAGRPDTITKEKLRLMKVYGVNRISINPQTMNDETLRAVGRKHTVEDIIRVFHEAREMGHENINMDLILGLPGETPVHVAHTMKEIFALQPDNLTVHTLAVKRASRLKEEFDQHVLVTAEVLEEMLRITAETAKEMGMSPYYMYRQKNMVGNFENVGYCTAGKECVYNVEIMEEQQTILAAGAGASTKIVDPETNRIERVFNVKSVEDYIGRIDEMIERKRVGLPKGGFL